MKPNTRLLGRLTDRAPKDGSGVVHLLDTWARLLQLAPDPNRAVGHIARLNGLSYEQVEHMREARNTCAHTIDGWPSSHDLTRAFGTAYALSELTRNIHLTPVRSPSPKFHRLQGRTDRAPKEPQESMGVVRVMDTWARLLILAPVKDRVVSHVVQISGLRFDEVDHLREVRKCCAHPDEGWPSSDDLIQAFRTAYALGEVTLGRLHLLQADDLT